jgi:hypothetical protein
MKPRGVAPITLEGDNPSMALADARQHRLLELLREPGDRPVAFAELHAGGISFPAAVVSELGLNGYVVERVYDHGRLVAGCACSIQNPRTHPPHTDGDGDGGRTDSQLHPVASGLLPGAWIVQSQVGERFRGAACRWRLGRGSARRAPLAGV